MRHVEKDGCDILDGLEGEEGEYPLIRLIVYIGANLRPKLGAIFLKNGVREQGEE